jgi:hypothetical protein
MAPAIDRVTISSSHFGAGDVALSSQVGQDPLRSPFGDADLFGNVACPGLGVTCDAEKNVRVVGEEDPRASRHTLRLRFSCLNHL